MTVKVPPESSSGSMVPDWQAPASRFASAEISRSERRSALRMTGHHQAARRVDRQGEVDPLEGPQDAVLERGVRVREAGQHARDGEEDQVADRDLGEARATASLALKRARSAWSRAALALMLKVSWAVLASDAEHALGDELADALQRRVGERAGEVAGRPRPRSECASTGGAARGRGRRRPTRPPRAVPAGGTARAAATAARAAAVRAGRGGGGRDHVALDDAAAGAGAREAAMPRSPRPQRACGPGARPAPPRPAPGLLRRPARSRDRRRGAACRGARRRRRASSRAPRRRRRRPRPPPPSSPRPPARSRRWARAPGTSSPSGRRILRSTPAEPAGTSKVALSVSTSQTAWSAATRLPLGRLPADDDAGLDRVPLTRHHQHMSHIDLLGALHEPAGRTDASPSARPRPHRARCP